MVHFVYLRALVDVLIEREISNLEEKKVFFSENINEELTMTEKFVEKMAKFLKLRDRGIDSVTIIDVGKSVRL